MAFIEISIDDTIIGKIKIELFDEIVPKTVKNFMGLIKGMNGMGYKNSKFHRIIPGFMIQGGDFTRNDGTGGFSIYGDKFNDENFELKHDCLGMVAMANSGPNTNGSQFYITLAETQWLDGKHVVFGKVTNGLHILKEMERFGRESGKPKRTVKITDCGIIN